MKKIIFRLTTGSGTESIEATKQEMDFLRLIDFFETMRNDLLIFLKSIFFACH